MNKLYLNMIALLNSADMIGSDNVQLGDAMDAVAEGIDRYGHLNAAPFALGMSSVLDNAFEHFDHHDAVQFLKDCRATLDNVEV